MDRSALERILKMAQRNLTILEEKIATFGAMNVPTSVQMEYELQKDKVAEIEGKLAALGGAAPTVTAAATPPQTNQPATTTVAQAAPAAPQAPSSSGNVRDQVFISYSHKDDKWLKRLQVHLLPLERQGKVKIWDDTDIKPGMKWRDEIKKALDKAKIAILLVSADFLASGFIDREELPALLKAATDDGATILPIIVSPASIRGTVIYEYQGFNTSSTPLSSMSKNEQEALFVKVVDRLNELLG